MKETQMSPVRVANLWRIVTAHHTGLRVLNYINSNWYVHLMWTLKLPLDYHPLVHVTSMEIIPALLLFRGKTKNSGGYPHRGRAMPSFDVFFDDSRTSCWAISRVVGDLIRPDLKPCGCDESVPQPEYHMSQQQKYLFHTLGQWWDLGTFYEYRLTKLLATWISNHMPSIVRD